MRKIRNCASAQMATGVSKCQFDFGKLKGAIIVERGKKLPADLTAEKLEEACHADRPDRVYPIFTFVEYAKNGGEPQVGATGYGPQGVTGVNARTDALTMDKFYEALNASLLKTMNTPYDVYFWDDKKMLYGCNDGTDVLAGIPMSTIYPTVTDHPTSSAKSTMVVNFCHEDAQASMENYDYIQLNFDPKNFAVGLVAVELVAVDGSKYKLIESIGGYDRTAEFGSLIASGATTVLGNVTSATYNAEDDTLSIVTKDSGVPYLKAPSALYEAGIKGIEQVVKPVSV